MDHALADGGAGDMGEITKPANDLQGKIFEGQLTVEDGLRQMASLVNAALNNG